MQVYTHRQRKREREGGDTHLFDSSPKMHKMQNRQYSSIYTPINNNSDQNLN